MLTVLRNFFGTWLLRRLGATRLLGCGCLFLFIGLALLVYALNQLF
jgi:hypothetical protein